MNAATAILERVRSAVQIDRDALIAEMERDFDAKLVSPTVSTMIRRGELRELESGHIALGDEDAIEKARQEREQRRADRDRPKMPVAAPSAQVAPVPDKPRLGSTRSALAIAKGIQKAVAERGPLTANEIAASVPGLVGNNVYHYCKSMVERGELIKRGREYAVSEAQFSARAPDLNAETTTAPAIDAAAAVAEVQNSPRGDWKSRLPGIAAGLGVSYNNLANDLEGVNYSSMRTGTSEERETASEEPVNEVRLVDLHRLADQILPVATAPEPPKPAAKTLADVARKHAATTAEEHVLQLGDVYIAVTAPATVATRVLSAALAVLGAQP